MFASPPQPLTRWQKRLLLAMGIAIALTRIYALSLSWWDWDEMLFQSAMVDYDVTIHHPHPPGFPLYIALARVARPLADSDFHALQAVNCLFASLLFPAMVFLSRELRMPFTPAVLSGTILAFMPPVWLFGGTAFSDVPSVVLVMFALALLLRGCRNRSSYFWGALALAASIGFRPQNLVIGLIPGALATWYRSKDRFREIAAATLLGAAVVGASFGGAVEASKDWPEYVKTVRVHQEYIGRVDSFRSEIRPPLRHLFDDFFFRQYRSGNAVNATTTALVLIGLIAAVVRRDRGLLLLAISFGPFCIAAWLMLDYLSLSRFAIGYAPLFAALAAAGVWVLAGLAPARRRDLVAGTAGAALTLAMASYALPAIREVRSTLSPPAAAIRWIRANLDPHTARIYTGVGLVPYAEYALRGYDTRGLRDERDLPAAEADFGRDSYLFREGVGGRDFVRERGRLWNLVRHRYFEVTVVSLSKAERFRDGWYGAENVGSELWRWMAGKSVTELPPLPGKASLHLELFVPLDSLPGPPTVTVRFNDQQLDSFSATSMEVQRTYPVDSREGRFNRLEISTSLTVNPKARGLANDPRDLGLQLKRLRWEEEQKAEGRKQK